MDIQKIYDLQSILSSDFIFDHQGIYSDSVGVFMPQAAVQGRFFSNFCLLSQEYLNNFENTYQYGPIFGTSSFMQNSANILALYHKQYEEDVSNLIILPKPRNLHISLWDALKKRSSSRYFDGSKINMQELSDFLYYSSGSISETSGSINGRKVKISRRPYPSGGGMYSIKILLAVYGVDKLKPAIYAYQPISHTLSFYQDICSLDSFVITKRYNAVTGNYDPIENFSPAILCLFVNNFSRARLKYGELSLLTALVDCGCLVQNCGLLAASLNLHFCVWAGFKKAEAEKKLNLNGLEKHLIMTALLGGRI